MRLICAAVILLYNLSLQAQDCKIEKGYAYQRTTIPGNIPRNDLDESGKEIERPVRMMNTFFIYVETNNGCNLRVTQLWILGKAFRVKQEEVKELPIVIHHTHPGTPPDTLVPHTMKRVFRLQPVADGFDEEKRIPVKQNQKSIRIEYLRKEKKLYYQVHDVKRIAPMVLQ